MVGGFGLQRGPLGSGGGAAPQDPSLEILIKIWGLAARPELYKIIPKACLKGSNKYSIDYINLLFIIRCQRLIYIITIHVKVDSYKHIQMSIN